MGPSRPNPALGPAARIFRPYNKCFSFILISLLFSKEVLAQGTSGFKPSSSIGSGKGTDFITNPHRSLVNNSQLYSSEDVYTRGNYLGVGASAMSTGQYGYLPQPPQVNYGQYGPTVTAGAAAAAGIGYQQGPSFIGGGGGDKGYPFPGLQFQYPFGGQFPGSHQHQQQPYPPQGFNPNQPGILPGQGFFYPPGFPPSQQQNPGFPGPQPLPPSGFPYPPQNQGQGYPPIGPGNGDGHLFLGLPRQIRVPGKIDITLNGMDAEIVCEFPRFLILIQKVYWHHKYDDPYGTYYDSNNGFGPRVTVSSPDKWKSFLRIRDYNEDDFGTYRCITSAILPDESSPPPYGQNPANNFILRSPSTTTETSLNPDDLTRLKLPNKSSKTRESKDFKFLSSAATNRVARKIRFSRDLSTTTAASTTSENILLTYAKNYLQGAVEKYKKNHGRPFDPKNHESAGSETVYDPYFYHRHNDPRNPRNYFIGGGTGNGYQTSLNPFPTSTPVPGGPGYPPGNIGHHVQDSRYGPYGNTYPTFNQAGGGAGGGAHGFNGVGGGLYAPFYKPSYGVFSIYQEIRFSPVNSRSSDSSSRTNKIR